jgi:predicted metalloendopeptidase
MTQEMQDAFRTLVNTSLWLDDDTKTLSGDKVAAMTLRIGYPDFILSHEELDERYETLNISRTAYFENMVALLRHANREERLRLGSAVNKTQWNTAPAVVNAYYSRNKNQISKDCLNSI